MLNGRFIELFESGDARRLSMANFSTFLATITSNGLAIASLWVQPALTPDLIYASAALGGVTIGVNKLGNVWQNIRVEQAKQGIQPASIVSPQPNLTQNINVSKSDESA